MSDFLDQVAADCREAETDLGDRTMIWNGGTYPCAPTSTSRDAVLVIGGREVEIRLTLRVRLASLPSDSSPFAIGTHPRKGEQVTFGGTVYHIGRVNNVQGVFLEIDLMDRNR